MDEVYFLDSIQVGKFNELDYSVLNNARQVLLVESDDLENLKSHLWNNVLEESQNEDLWSWGLYWCLRWIFLHPRIYLIYTMFSVPREFGGFVRYHF